jgi:hypothetical protein
MTVVYAWFTRVLSAIYDWPAATAEATEPLTAILCHVPLLPMFIEP